MGHEAGIDDILDPVLLQLRVEPCLLERAWKIFEIIVSPSIGATQLEIGR
jgi:hypothetical protein